MFIYAENPHVIYQICIIQMGMGGFLCARTGNLPAINLLNHLRLFAINLLHLLVLQLLQLLVRLAHHVRQNGAVLLPVLERLLMLSASLAHAVPPALTSVLYAAHEVLLALHLDLEEELELVVVGALGLLVEVLARLDGGHDGLEIFALIDEKRDDASGARHDLGELAQGKSNLGAIVVLDGDGEGAEGVGVEAAAVQDGLELGLEVGIDGDVCGGEGGEVEGVFGVGLAVVGLGGGAG